MHLEYKVTLGNNGRLLLPAKIRKHFKIAEGDQLMLVADQELKLVPLKNIVHQFQAFVKSHNKNKISLVDSLRNTRSEDFNNE